MLKFNKKEIDAFKEGLLVGMSIMASDMDDALRHHADEVIKLTKSELMSMMEANASIIEAAKAVRKEKNASNR